MNDDIKIFGPLYSLIGIWEGDKGIDVAPEKNGEEENPYYETIIFEPVGTATNAEEQVLSVVRYHQVVTRKSDKIVFHDEIGYWYFDSKTNQVIHSLTIPRAVCVLAGGKYEQSGNGVKFEVSARNGSTDFGVLESPFMKSKAHTKEYTQTLKVKNDILEYNQTTVVEIYGRVVNHTDKNVLNRKK